MRFALLATILAAFTVHALADDKEDKKKKEKEELAKKLAEADALFENEKWAVERRKLIDEWKELLSKAEGMDLYRLNPRKLGEDAKDKKAFHGYEILATVTLDKDQRREAGAYFGKTLHWNILRQAVCFDPNHGLRVTVGKKTLDFVICYSCDRMDVYEGDKPLPGSALVEIEPNVLTAILDKAKKP